MKLILSWLASLLLLASCQAQYATVHALLTDPSGSVPASAFLHVELRNCGDNFPSYANSVVAQTAFDLRPSQADGSIVGQVLGSDVILCGGVASTFYHVTPMKNPSTPLGQPEDFEICSGPAGPACYPGAGNTWELSLAQPMVDPPGVPGFSFLMGNPVLGQVWTQPVATSAQFFGVFDFSHATVQGFGGTSTAAGPVGSLQTRAPNGNFFGEPLLFADQFTNIQAAINATACPAAGCTIFVPQGSTYGSTAISISKPIHLIFDQGTYTYSGTGAAITCTSAGGVVIEGAGHDDPGSSGTKILITGTAVSGISATSCGTITLRDFNIVGPGSGTGKGIVLASTRSKTENVSILSFGGDGLTIDGSVVNANVCEIDHVHSASNGGSGFVLPNSNGQVCALIGADAQANGGDGFKISNSGNVFVGTNSNANASGIGYHFLSGATYNSGSIFSDAPNAPEATGFQFDSGAVSNCFFIIGGSGNAPVVFASGANNNCITSPKPTVTDSGTGNRYQSDFNIWNTFDALTMRVGNPGATLGQFSLANTTSGVTNIVPSSGALNAINLTTPNPTVNATFLASLGSGTTALNVGALGGAGCESGITVSVTGVTTTSHIDWHLASDPLLVAGYGAAPVAAVKIDVWPTANAVNIRQCSAVAVTPGAMSILWEVH